MTADIESTIDFEYVSHDREKVKCILRSSIIITIIISVTILCLFIPRECSCSNEGDNNITNFTN